jgi:hypothetical protein
LSFWHFSSSTDATKAINFIQNTENIFSFEATTGLPNEKGPQIETNLRSLASATSSSSGQKVFLFIFSIFNTYCDN